MTNVDDSQPLIRKLLDQYESRDFLQIENHPSGRPSYPTVTDFHGEPTGYAQVRESSGVTPSCWLEVNKYDFGGQPPSSTVLHFRWWEARRLGLQLLSMADRLKPDSTTDDPKASETVDYVT